MHNINTGPTTIHYGKDSVMSLADRDYMQYKPSRFVLFLRWCRKVGIL